MRLISLVFAGGLVALSACAQPPAMKEYAYPAWGFAVSFRAPPMTTDSPASADGTSAHTLTLESNLAGRDNLVNVIDGSGSAKPDDQVLSDAPAVLARSAKATLGPVTYVASGKAIGREFRLDRPGQQPARARIFVANKHLYEIISSSSLGPDDPEATAFLDSFRLL